MRKRQGKKGLMRETVIFLVLNLVFLSVMFAFLYLRIGDAAVLEEKYAKQIALLIDSAKPGMIISLDMEDALDIARKKGLSTGAAVSESREDAEGASPERGAEEAEKKNEIVVINENIVTVSLRPRGNYSYSFFNDVKVNEPYFNENRLILFIGGKDTEGFGETSQPEAEIPEEETPAPETTPASSEKPPVKCEDCYWFFGYNSFACPESECSLLDSRMRQYGKRCEFIPKKNIFGKNKCITVELQ